jgi:GT2 family glycosyltransferase
VAVALLDADPARAVALARPEGHVSLVVTEPLDAERAATCRAAGVEVVDAPELDVRLVSRWLTDGYRLYRAVRDAGYDRLVFQGHDAYCALRARQLGLAFAGTEITVEPADENGERPDFLPMDRVGELVTEQIVQDLLNEQPTVGREPPSVSVVVAFHERTNYLDQCLDALTRQTHPALEVLVADDGSASRGAVDYLSELEGRQYPWPFRVLRLPRGGVAATRNRAADAASHDTLLFVDDDDVPYETLVEVLARGWAAAGVDVVAAGSRVFRGEGVPSPVTGDKITIPFGNARELGLLGNHFGSVCCLWSRGTFERLGGFRDVFYEDWEVLARASLQGVRIAGSPDPLYWYRIAAGSRFSGASPAKRETGRTAIAELYESRLPDDMRLLPYLAAGAYAELERSEQHAPPRRPRAGVAALRQRLGAQLRRGS